MKERRALLEQMPLFFGLDSNELEKISSLATVKIFDKGEMLFSNNDLVKTIFCIEFGKIKLSETDSYGQEKMRGYIGAEEMLPSAEFLDRTLYPFDAIALELTKALIINISDYKNLLMEFPEMAIKLAQQMTRKVAILSRRINELVNNNTGRQLLGIFQTFYKSLGAAEDGSVYVQMPLTIEELATATGMNDVSIESVLMDWENRKLIKSGRHGIGIYNLEKLNSYVHNIPVRR